MPLSDNPATNETAGTLVKTLQGIFGTPAGYRPGESILGDIVAISQKRWLTSITAHARGRLAKGTFTPTHDAAFLSTAPHFNNASTPILVRFSNSTGIPEIPDTDNNANPRGMAVRFLLGDDGHRHTDVITHSTPFFAMRTGEGFLDFLHAVGSGTIGEFLEKNPSAAAFVQAPKPFPQSFAREKYFGVNAFKLVDTSGKETFVRYRIIPNAGHAVLSNADVESKYGSYLFDELEDRLAKGPVTFTLHAQIAEADDPTDDATKHWPEDRKFVELGTIKVGSVLPEGESREEQQRIIFDPIPRVQGVEASADPLLDVRASLYLISGRERRAAANEKV